MDFGKMFKGCCGNLQPGMCKLTMNGKTAVKCQDGTYKTYNLQQDRLVNISNFGFDADGMFFVIPTMSLKPGDIILLPNENGVSRPKCVLEVHSSKKIITSIVVIDYDTSEVKTIKPTRHVIMGATWFCGKIVNLLGNSFKSSKGMNGLMKIYFMSQLFGGGKKMSSDSMGGMFGDMNPMMFMMMSGGDGMNLFDGMLGDNDLFGFGDGEGLFGMNDDDTDEEDTEEEEAPVKTSKKKVTKKTEEE